VPADVVVGVTRDTTVPEPIRQHVVSRVVAITPVHDTLTLETSGQASDDDHAGQDESQPTEDAHRLTMPSLIDHRTPPEDSLVADGDDGVRVLMVLSRTCVRHMPPCRARSVIWHRLCEPTWQRESTRARARTADGDTLEVNARDVVGRYILYFGVWEPNLTAWLKRRLAPGDCFVDVGANVGYYTLLASRLVGGEGRVVAIEPHPRLHATLTRNAAGLPNVRLVRAAVWDREADLDLFSDADGMSGQTTAIRDWAAKWQLHERVPVQALPLDTVLSSGEAAAARLVKIDVEGAEWQAAAGMTRLLADGRDDLEVTLEVSPGVLKSQGKTPDDLVAVFREHGFHPYRIENRYDPSVYLDPPPIERPQRITEIPADRRQTDVIFSREDADEL